MKKALFFAVAAMSATAPQAETVYICHGPKSHRYHKTPKCKGLCRCSTELKQVTISEAEKMQFTPCKICHKRR